MRVKKIVREQAIDFTGGCIRLVILGDVARGVPINEAELRTALQTDGTHEDVAQVRILGAWFAQREFDQRAVLQRRCQQDVELGAMVRRHGLYSGKNSVVTACSVVTRPFFKMPSSSSCSICLV